MSTLIIAEIIKVIKTKQPVFITKAKKEQFRLNTLINGVGVPEYLEKIEGYENKTQFDLRKKFSGNVAHIFSNLIRPIDKVFTAKGGSVIYGTVTDSSEKVLKSHLSNIKNGKNIRQWIQSIQTNKYYTDPSGLVFFEWGNDEDDISQTYPSLKSIQEIRNYKTSGRDLDWVLFEPYKKEDENGRKLRGEYFRFVDDSKDYLFVKEGDNVTLVEEETYENPWGKVPAIINSEISNHSLEYYDSPFHNVVELSDKYLRGQSTRNIYEQVLMYPSAWMYAQKCDSCKGSGEIDGITCTSCNGTKTSMKRDVSDMILLNPPKNADSPIIAPNVMGFSQVELTPYVEAREELIWLGDVMSFSIWGSTHQTGDNETATAAFLDLQPVNDRQGLFSDSFEDLEKKMTDIVGEFYLGDSYDPDGTSINYGRRYLMELPDKVWEKYIAAKEKQAPKSSLDHLLNQYYQSEYMNDIYSLGSALKAMRVEPFVHKSDEEVKELEVFKKDLIAKIYFNEWWLTLDQQDILVSSVDKLKKEFEFFINTKIEENEKSEDVQTETSKQEGKD